MREHWWRNKALMATLCTVTAVAVGCGGSDSSGSGSGGGAKGSDANPRKGSPEEFIDISKLCGDKPITVALADGFGGNTWRRTARKEFELEAKKCKNIKKVLYADGGGDPQKAISDINSFASQGVDALVVFPDAGPALLPAIRNAYRRGVKVVPYFGVPLLKTATPGKDFAGVVGPASSCTTGKRWAEWMVKQLKGKGNVAYFGGPAGNPVSEEAFPCVQKVLAKHPGMKMLESKYIVTNWDSAQQQKLTSQLLARYPKVDGLFADFSDSALGSVRAFQAAKRPMVALATQDSNGLGCAWKKLSKTNPKFDLATISSGQWLVRPALRRAVSAAQETANREPSLIDLPIIEDSTDKAKLPKCDPALPEGAILSATLTPEQQKKLFK